MDQCEYCIIRGNHKECLRTSCNNNSNWIAIELYDRLKKTEKELNKVKKDIEQKRSSNANPNI